MEYIIKHCPKCKGELHIPSDLETCICMYCGQSFAVSERQDQKPVEPQHLEANYRKALEEIPQLIKDYEVLLKQFTRENYANAFETYTNQSRWVLQAFEAYASLSNEKRVQVITEVANTLVEDIEKEIAGKKIRLANTEKIKNMDMYRFFLTVYTVPMVRFLQWTISEDLADAIVLAWVNKYPKYSFQKSDFESLEGGFRRKGFCFITTAVCDTLKKADDCEELTSLRHFRDTYMQQTPQRQALVEKYYIIAPVIVTAINLRKEAGQIYQKLWENYITPCLQELKKGNLSACEEGYVRMMTLLEEEYFILPAK